MKYIIVIFILVVVPFWGISQVFIDFENNIETSDFIDFDGGVATVIANPSPTGENISATVAQIVRTGGPIWSGSKLLLPDNLDFTTNGQISMKVFTSAPIGTIVKFKLEGQGATERDVPTTVSNHWETLTWDFTGEPTAFNYLVFMFDFGNVGDGSINSTFLFDDIQQVFGGAQIDLPVDFEKEGVNYTMTDFGGNYSELVLDPEDNDNHVIKVNKTALAATWAGTTIGTPGGFKTNIPLSLTDSKMYVRVWSPVAGQLVRLKVEDSKDPTHTCETETKTTTSDSWEYLEFDFINQAPGTEYLEIGVTRGWRYNMASIFFNFGTEGPSLGEWTYYFDDVTFGAPISTTENLHKSQVQVVQNPTSTFWKIVTDNILQYQLYNDKGDLLLYDFINSSELQLDASSYLQGTYFCKIITPKGLFTIKLVKFD